jgi:hypothetical protein
MSAKFENVIIHLNVGAQKNIVNGPAACSKKDLADPGQGNFITADWIWGTIICDALIINMTL